MKFASRLLMFLALTAPFNAVAQNGPITVDDTKNGTFIVTTHGVSPAVAAKIASDLTPAVVTPPPVTPPPVNPPPPAAGAITWMTVPHVLNDWSVAGQVTFGAHKYYTESSMKPYAAQLSTNTTSPIYRGETRNNELWASADGGNDTERAELDGSVTLYPKGTEIWVSYQFLVEPGLPMIAGAVQPSSPGNPGGPLAWGVIGQVHGDGSESAVPWGLSIVGEALTVVTQRGNQVETTYPVKAIVRGRVYNVVLRINVTGTTASTMTCWIDGVQVAISTGVVIGGADAHNYVKAGLYRGWQGDGYSPLAVQVANLEHGTASLIARVAFPLIWPSVKVN